MKFRVNAEDLNAALEVVTIVTPRALTPAGGTGYLFVVRADKCSLYSRDSLHVAKAEFPITDVEGDGSFVYPAEYMAAFRLIKGPITFTAVSDNETFTITYEADSGETAEHTGLDPRLIPTCDKDFDEASDERTFPAGLLREAITQSSEFVAEGKNTRVEDHFKTIQIFDDSNPAWAKGNGHLFAANGVQAYFFYSEAFEGKAFSVHGQHLALLTAFLAKAGGDVTVKTGSNFMFMVSEGRVFGWAKHQKGHQKFAYYKIEADKVILAADKDMLLRALRHTRAELSAKRDKIRVTFSQQEGTLRFEVAEATGKAKSILVPVKVVSQEGNDLTVGVNIDHFITTIKDMKGSQVELRVAFFAATGNAKEGAVFRTIEEFYADANGKPLISAPGVKPEGGFLCRVTRFMPSKD